MKWYIQYTDAKKRRPSFGKYVKADNVQEALKHFPGGYLLLTRGKPFRNIGGKVECRISAGEYLSVFSVTDQ